MPPDPVFINILFGGRCDLTCPYCKSHIHPIQQMGIDRWERFFADLGAWLPGRHVSLSGGEPLLNPDLEQAVRAAAQNGLLPSICTSGGPFTERIVREMATWPLTGVTISLDGLPETHDRLRGRKGLFQTALGFTDYLKQLNPNIRIVSTTVISRHNQDELAELIEFLLDKQQIDQVTFQAVTTQSDPTMHWKSPAESPHFPAPEKGAAFCDWLLSIHDTRPKLKNSKKQIDVWKTYFLSPEKVRALMENCQIANYTLTVAPNGNVKLCDFHPAIGNVAETNVRDIWLGEKARALRKSMQDCRLFCNYLVNCGFEDFHLRLLTPGQQDEYRTALDNSDSGGDS